MSTIAGSPAIQEFRAAALVFCRLLDDVDKIEVSPFLRACHESLARLYVAGLSLPVAEPGTEEVTFRRDSARRKSMYAALTRKLGVHNLYWLVFDPVDSDDRQSIQHTLADDLADVYEDVRSGLEPWPPSTSEEADDRIWAWRFGFENHWGRHAGNAIRVLWSLTY